MLLEKGAAGDVMKFIYVLAASLALDLTASAAYSQSTITSSEAVAMLDKATMQLRYEEATTLSKLSSGEDGFRDRSLFVMCFNAADGKIRAHIGRAMIGTDVRKMKDSEGAPLGEKIFNGVANSKKLNVVDYNDAIDYKSPLPGTTTPVSKKAYIVKVNDLGCAALW